MQTRSADFNEYLSQELKDLSFARGFLLGLLEAGDDLQIALGRLIRAYGVKEFARLVKIEESVIQQAVTPGHDPTIEILEKLLAPLKLSLGVKPTL